MSDAPPAVNGSGAGVAWKGHALLGGALRLLVVLIPTACCVSVVWLLSSHWGRPASVLGVAGWWLATSGAGILTAIAVERLTRLLLPLAALLQLSLLFPDRAPRRLDLARQAARPEQVLTQLEQLGRDAKAGDVTVAQSVLELTAALTVHDSDTRSHCERVRIFTDMITRELHLPEADRDRMRWAAMLHDVGKLTVPKRILTKQGRPSDSEWRTLRAHTTEGVRLIAPIMPWLAPWGLALEQHHERWDGLGYPLGLKGSEISLAGRIISVADVFEVMTAGRPYRRALSVAAARRELVRVSGSQLDPKVVRAFLNVSVGELWPVLGIGALISQVPLGGQLAGLFGQALPALGGGAAAVGAAGALLIAGTAHTNLAPPRSVSAPMPSASATAQRVLDVGSQPTARASATQGSVATPTAPPAANPPSPAPSATATPTPTPTPIPTPTPSPRTEPIPIPTPVSELLTKTEHLLQQLLP